MSEPLKRHQAVGQWLVCVIINLALPVLPLAVEFFITDRITTVNMLLTASIYSITTGVVSKNAVVAASSIAISFFYTGMFGSAIKESVGNVNDCYALWVVAIMFLTNAALKFQYHVVELRAYTDFSLRND